MPLKKMSNTKHTNIPIFIPHLGCPHNCVFCNQKTISGTKKFDRSQVVNLIDETLKTIPENYEKEIAFFGGSFTGIDRDLMIYLLDTAEGYIKNGLVSSIRLSTRPDYIDDEILTILSNYSVKNIELGLQSFDEEVLTICERGHSATQAENACRLIKKYGFNLVGQMMIGLPNSTREKEIMTATKICDLGADAARIYPTVVLKNTQLSKMTTDGTFNPIEVDEIVSRGCDVLEIFDNYHVEVIRIGLCSSDICEDEVVRNTFHPAIGELIISEMFLRKIEKEIENRMGDRRKITIYCPAGCTSKVVGQNKKNKLFLEAKYGFIKTKIIENNTLLDYNIRCEFE